MQRARRFIAISAREAIENKKVISDLGMVFGSTVRTRNVVVDVFARFRAMFGGEIKGYTQLLQDSRAEATERMISAAEQIGADAIVRVRYQSASIMDDATEILCYGTAVKLDSPVPSPEPFADLSKKENDVK